MALAFYGAEFVVNGVSNNDYAGAAAALANGGFVLTYASYPTFTYMNRSYDGLGTSIAGPTGIANKLNGGITSKNGGIAQLSSGALVEAFSDTGPAISDPIDVGITSFPQDLSSFSPLNPPSNSTTLQFNPSLASSPLGGFMVAWDDDNPVYGRPARNVIAQVFDNSLNGGTAFVVSEPALSAGDQVDPDIGRLASGNYVVVWQDNSGLDGSGAGIRAREFSTAGAALTTEIPVNEGFSLDQTNPAVAGLTDGGFVVVWQTLGDIKARLFNAAGTAVTGDLAIAQFPVGTQLDPDVTALPDGGFLVAWTTQTTAPIDGGDGAGSSIKARAFSSAGAATSTEILVNTVTTADQVQPVVATLADGRVVVSWTDNSNAALQGSDVRSQLLDPRMQGVNVTGTADADKYVGSAFADILSGFGGPDLLNGGAGGDVMVGGAGDDTFIVDNAGDQALENPSEGTDIVLSSVHFTLGVNVENLVLQGSADLQGHGNSLANTIFGNSGNNLIDGDVGADTMIGGAGNDTYFVDNAGDGVAENPNQGNDTILSSISFTLPVNLETLVLQGSADLQAYGNSSINTLYGNSGNNLLNGLGGADLMVGGAGNDTYFVDDSGDSAFEAANEGNDTVFASANYGLAANVENLVMQGGADLQGYGSAQANVIYGNGGNNLLNGAGGVDLMVGGAGNDTYFVDDPSDSCFEVAGEGNDAVFASSNYGLPADVETLVLQGSADLQGYGNNTANSIFGNSGNNLINGGGGADTMVGGVGNDTYFVDHIGDGILENAGEGSDSVLAGVTYALSANVEALVLQGAGAIDGVGNSLANSLFGNSGVNTLDGGGGADQLTGGLGNDIFVFRPGEANGDTVVDFDGGGASPGDSLQFVGYGIASFTTIDATHWQVNFNGGASHDVITFINGASIDPTDFVFS
jgi:Ca2+-binding RTX toxin-like protein